MAILPPILYPVIYISAVIVTSVSGYLVFRQRVTAYNYARLTLVAVHAVFIGLILFDFLRTSYYSLDFIPYYAVGGTSLVLIDVLLLTLFALTIYVQPSGVEQLGILRELRTRGKMAGAFVVYAALIFLTEAYFLSNFSFTARVDTTLGGVEVPGVAYSTTYLNLLFAVLVGFMVFPSALMLLVSRKVRDPKVRFALTLLPLCWSIIGVDLLYFDGYLISAGVDATDVGYLIAAAAFGIMGDLFSRTSMLTSMFAPMQPSEQVASSFPFSARLGIGRHTLGGKTFLLEVEADMAYEEIVAEYATELLSSNYMVYAFTWKGTPVFNALSKMSGVRLFILSDVSSPRQYDRPGSLVLPEGDHAFIVDMMRQAVTYNPDIKVGLIFDSITQMATISDFEETYAMLRKMNATSNEPHVSAVFLMTVDAHDEKEVKLARSLFANRLSYTKETLTITRSAH